MNKDEEMLRITLIEYLKEMKPESNLLTIFRRSSVRFDFISTYTGWKHPGQMTANVELRVPIPLLKEAEKSKNDIREIVGKCYNETDKYGFGTVEIKPKLIESDEVEYKENDVHFSDIDKEIIYAIKDAKYVIWIAVAWFTDTVIFEELKKRKQDGLNIRIITSEEYSNRHLMDDLAKEFEVIPIKKSGNHRLHDKFCIIDFDFLMHGSYNLSKNAKGNYETWATTTDRDLVKKFADEFIKLYSKKDPDENWLESF